MTYEQEDDLEINKEDPIGDVKFKCLKCGRVYNALVEI